MVRTAPDANFTLKDGASVRIRTVRPEDDRCLVEIFNRLSPLSVYQRFFTAIPELTPAMARYLANVVSRLGLALIAEAETGPVGVARYERTRDPGLVEIALAVVDDWQNRGLGRTLLREIRRAAEGNGIHRFWGEILAENRRMLRLLATEFRIEDSRTEAGVTTVLLTSRLAGAAAALFSRGGS